MHFRINYDDSVDSRWQWRRWCCRYPHWKRKIVPIWTNGLNGLKEANPLTAHHFSPLYRHLTRECEMWSSTWIVWNIFNVHRDCWFANPISRCTESTVPLSIAFMHEANHKNQFALILYFNSIYNYINVYHNNLYNFYNLVNIYINSSCNAIIHNN